MGGAKFMGKDPGIVHTKELLALEVFAIWLIGGLPLSFLGSIIIFPEPNLSSPIIFYIIILVLLWIRYIRKEKRGLKND